MRIMLVLLVVLTTGFRFENGMIYDDVYVIEQVGVIHQTRRAPEAFVKPTMFISQRPADAIVSVDTYRPIPVLSFFLNAAISGKRLWSYHLFNLGMHAGCVLLLFGVIRRWLGPGKIKAAAIGAAFFAVQPWLAEAHVWINGRSDPLALAFGLGAALVLLRREVSPARMAIAGALFFLGLLSKEVLLTTLPAFVFLDPKRTLPLRTRLVRLVPLVIASVAYLVIRHRVLGGMKTHEDQKALVDAASRGPALVFDALFHLLVPSVPFLRSLRDDFNGVPRWLLGVALVALLGLVFVVHRARTRLTTLPFASLFFLGSLAPIAGISVVLWPGYGRYLYIPAAALALALAEMFSRLRLRGRVRQGAFAGLALYLIVQAALLVSFTRDMDRDETLYLAATERRPTQAYGWGFLGFAYALTGQDELAVGALRRASTLDPDEDRYPARLAILLSQMRRCDEARDVALAALAKVDNWHAAEYHRALALCADRPSVAVHHLRACLVLRPIRTDCEQVLRDLLTVHPAAPKARAALRKSMEAQPIEPFDEKWGPLAREPE